MYIHEICLFITDVKVMNKKGWSLALGYFFETGPHYVALASPELYVEQGGLK